jgi:hypothetical protein
VEERPLALGQLLAAERRDRGDEGVALVIPGELVDACSDCLLAPDDHHEEKVPLRTTMPAWSVSTSP